MEAAEQDVKSFEDPLGSRMEVTNGIGFFHHSFTEGLLCIPNFSWP